MKYPKSIDKCKFRLLFLYFKCRVYLLYLIILGYQFTRDGRYMLLAERRDCKDFCSIFSSGTWELLKVGGIIIF